jgi:nucleoside-diphosphate-sugar epimerase
MSKDKIWVIGASGQIGSDLVVELRNIYGGDNVIASDIKEPSEEVKEGGPFEPFDVCSVDELSHIVKKYQITEVYNLAALLSGTAEKDPRFAWRLNMNGLFNILNVAREGLVKKVFWPSSIAVFGPTTPDVNTPQVTITEPNTVYGITKIAGERWCDWFYNKYNIDVRSVRYPGLIGYKALPGGGTTDYAVDIFYHAIRGEDYTCFLSKDTVLPMMYMPDGIRATLELMHAPENEINVRSSYNLSGMSFDPQMIYESIKRHYPNFKIHYKPDFRQQIADTWPKSIDDSVAKAEWGWKPEYDLDTMVDDMILHLKPKLTK